MILDLYMGQTSSVKPYDNIKASEVEITNLLGELNKKWENDPDFGSTSTASSINVAFIDLAPAPTSGTRLRNLEEEES